MRRLGVVLLSVVLLSLGVAGAQDHEMHMSKVTDTPQWESLKSLVGEWDGYHVEAGKKLPTHISIRMTGDGSAVMHWIDAGTPHEMVTMFHMDQDSLMATHYCAAHNQPRMAMVPARSPNQIAFQFVDGTNIAPGDGYMKGVVFTFIDADHHEEAWTHSSAPGATVFKFTRKK